MFQRLFGQTEQEQLHYLQTRVIITAAGAAVGVVSFILALLGSVSIQALGSVGELLMTVSAAILFVALFMWGFGAIKALFGIGSIGAIFSGNVVFGVVIFFFSMFAAYLISIIVAFLGIGRFIYLKVKASKDRK